MGLKAVLRRPLEIKCQKEYEKKKERSIKTFAEALSEEPATTWEDDKITDDFLFFSCEKGTLAKNAKNSFGHAFYEHPEAVLAYCDETFEENPWYKPDWSPDTFLDHFYFGSLVAIRFSALQAVVDNETAREALRRKEEVQILDSKSLYHLCYSVLKIKGGFNKRENGGQKVVHLPQILFLGEKPWASEKQIKFMKKEKELSNQAVSVIIPSKDHPQLVEKCIRSLYATTEGIKLEILVVDNGSSEENRSKLNRLAQELSFTYLYEPMEFHFAKMCNLGAANTKEKHLLFLNDDIECVHKGWLSAMLLVAQRDHVAAVGSKLLYPDSDKIQHAGITNLPMGPVHKLQFLSDSVTHYDGYNRGVRNVLAVTGACLLVRRELFCEAGGMSEELAVAFNDVELCFSLYEKGYYNVVVQDYPLVHHESVSRGDDETCEKWKRLMKERDILYRLHPTLQGIDPFYNIHLNRHGLNSEILPEYLSGKHFCEKATPVLAEQELLTGARQDACVLLRFDVCEDEEKQVHLQGYSVVLGSDNTCYEKELLLQEVQSKKIYRIPFTGQYRYDIEKNMMDQKNVAMSGFWLNLEKEELPEGTYRLGMYAKARIGHTGLYCFSTRQIERRNTIGL